MAQSFVLYLTLFCIGFANSLPLPLIGSTLFIWLAEEGFSKGAIGWFALLAIPFSLRVIWSPIVDIVSLPFFKKSQRKVWVVGSLLAIGGALLAMSFLSPSASVGAFSMSVLLLAVASGCLYIAGLAYELDSLEPACSSIGSACVLTGYRLGLLCAGAGALYLSFFGGWDVAFRVMSGLIFVASLVVAAAPEPFRAEETIRMRKAHFSQYSNKWVGVWQECLVRPCSEFLQRAEWKEILALVLVFKIGDQLSHSMVGPFYLSLGFTKAEIATASKLWGMCATIFGAFFAGIFFRKRDMLKSLCLVASLHSISLLCLSMLSFAGDSLFWLSISVALENCTGGMAMALFISFLWRILDRNHSSAQYALLWSFFSLKGEFATFIGSYIAIVMPWSCFFGFVAAISGLSLLAAYLYIKKKISSRQSR